MSRVCALLISAVAFLSPSTPCQGQDAGALADLDDLLGIEISAAAKYAQTAKEAAASVTVITREDIEAYGYRTVADALVQVRGFYGTYDRNYFYLGTRGFGRPTDYNNRILLLLDGQPMNENFYSSASLGSDFALPISMVERIEVVRGPGSALYGNSAMFGVVNVVTRTGHDLQGGQVRGDVGSYGMRSGSVVIGHESASGLELSFSGQWSDVAGQNLYFPSFDDPSTNDGIAERQDWEKSSGFYAIGRYGPVSLRTVAYRREKAVPTGAWETVFNAEQTTLDEQWSVDALFEENLGTKGRATARTYFTGYAYDGVYPYGDDYTEADGNLGRWFGAEGKLRWDFSPSHRLTLGTDLRRNNRVRYFANDGETSLYDEDFPFTVLSAFGQDEVNLFGNLVVTLGARLDHHSDLGGHLSPRAALVYHPGESTTLKALVAEAFRYPNAYELYYEYSYDGGGGALQNPNLDPEKIRTIEFAMEQRLSEAFWAAFSLFDYSVRGLIDQVEAEEGTEYYQFQNQGDIDARGIEVELTFRTKSGLGGFANAVHQSVRTKPEEEGLTNSPQTSFRAGAFVPVFDRVNVAFSLRYDSERWTVWETKSEAYTVANLTLSTRRFLDRFDASVTVKNLFDHDYHLPGGWEHSMETILQNGRNLVASIAINF